MAQKFAFKKEMYPKIALLKAAYSFTDEFYVHLDCSEDEYIVLLESKTGSKQLSEKDFYNEMLTQSLRHEVYIQTKDIRNMLTARAIATSLIDTRSEEALSVGGESQEILKDWFENDD